MSDVLERFLRYVAVDTQSSPESESSPSTTKQKDLGRLLVEELLTLGLKDATMNDFGYVTATLPGNLKRDIPVLGLIAHMDTSPEISGANVKPRLVEYAGGDIVLNPEGPVVLSPVDFPELARYTGKTLIVTDGTTLLGADDKAGIAEILSAVRWLVEHPELPHGTLKIAFTPDEEVGRGADHFDVPGFGAQFAYTVDGGEMGELEYETFNAAGARIRIQGRSVHPGTAKNKMKNANMIALDLASRLPSDERPETTEGTQGFYHLVGMHASVEEAQMNYIIRDHDRQIFEARKAKMEAVVAEINAVYGPGTATLEMRDQYYNMKEKILPEWHLIETAQAAMQAAGIPPRIIPVRGGTDGSRLSYMGLPTPNLFTGGHNAHGKYEYLPVFEMEKAVEVLLNIVDLYAKK